MLPLPHPPFRWVSMPWGPGLECTALSPHARHLFTARGVDAPEADRGSGWTSLGEYLGVHAASVWRLRQVHGTTVYADGLDECDGAWPEGDLLATTRDDVALAVRTADCVPILLVDTQRDVVAAVHAGWRGTAQGAVQRMVVYLTDRFGTAPANLLAAVGPSIGPEAYEVGQDVIDAFITTAAAAAQRRAWWTPRTGRPGKYLVDLWTATQDQLEASGVPAERVHLSRLCTATHADVFHSHRAHGSAAGRMVAAIRRTAGGPRLEAGR